MPSAMSPEDLAQWVRAAAVVLRRVHEATRRTDGTVLVHGDFWLGNLLVDGARIVAVVDWATSHWGDASADVQHLVDHLEEHGHADPATADHLRDIVADVMGRLG